MTPRLLFTANDQTLAWPRKPPSTRTERRAKPPSRYSVPWLQSSYFYGYCPGKSRTSGSDGMMLSSSLQQLVSTRRRRISSAELLTLHKVLAWATAAALFWERWSLRFLTFLGVLSLAGNVLLLHHLCQILNPRLLPSHLSNREISHRYLRSDRRHSNMVDHSVTHWHIKLHSNQL